MSMGIRKATFINSFDKVRNEVHNAWFFERKFYLGINQTISKILIYEAGDLFLQQ